MDERRQVPRYFADLSAALERQPSGGSHVVQIEVLSVQGCCLRGEDIPEVGRKCGLTMRWHGQEICAGVEVAWKNAQGLAGLRFLDMDQNSSEVVRELCSSLRLQPLVPWSARENP